MKKAILFLLALSCLIVSCNSDKKEANAESKGATMSSSTISKQDRNKKVIRETMDNFAKRDFDACFKDVSPGYIDYADGSMPPITSVDTLKKFFQMITNSIENYKANDLQYYTDGDYVLVVGEWTGTFKQDLAGIKATGKPVKFKDLDMFKLNDDGKIIEHTSVQNLAAILISSGMIK